MATVYPVEDKYEPNNTDNKLDRLAAFRKRYFAQRELAAFNQIQSAFKDNKGTLRTLSRLAISDTATMRADLISLLQNIGLTAALLGAISVTVLLSSPTRADALTSSQHILSDDTEKVVTQLFYAFWSVAAMSEIAAVVVVTFCTVHMGLMLNANDEVWFQLRWDFVVRELPQILLVIGCFTTWFGCMMGAFLVGDNTTGYFTFLFGMVLMAIVLPTWLYMLYVNVGRVTAECVAIKKSFLADMEHDLV